MHALNFDQLNIQFGHLGSQDGIFLSLYINIRKCFTFKLINDFVIFGSSWHIDHALIVKG